jgi:thymidylate kinase
MKLVSFEGSDYSGKSATSSLLAQRASIHNPNVVFNSGTLYFGQDMGFLDEVYRHCDELQKEAIYTAMLLLDKKLMPKQDERVIIQDRYWMSVMAYGRFFNGERSLFQNEALPALMINPDAVVYLYCSVEEKIKRSRNRVKMNSLDRILLAQPDARDRLEEEIRLSLNFSKNLLSIDTTGIPITTVTDRVHDYLTMKGIL